MKRILATLLALVLCLGVTPSLAADTVTLVVWDDVFGPDEWIYQAGELFTQQHPNIRIEFAPLSPNDTVNQIALDGPAGVGADVFAAPHDRLGEMISSGLVLPVVNPQLVTSLCMQSCIDAVTLDDVLYGYPTSAETYALFYNKDLMETPPTTWEELTAFCETFNAANPGKYGFALPAGDIYYTIIFINYKGNRLFGPDGTDSERTWLNTPEAVEGIEVLRSFRNLLDIPATDLTTSILDASFISGAFASIITGPWNITSYEEAGVNFGVAPLPSLPGEDQPATSFSGVRAMYVSAFSEHPEEAALFCEFLMSPEMQLLRYECTGALPAASVQVDSPYLQGMVKQLEYTNAMPSIPAMQRFWDVGNSASSNIWDGADIQTELDTADKAILAD